MKIEYDDNENKYIPTFVDDEKTITTEGINFNEKYDMIINVENELSEIGLEYTFTGEQLTGLSYKAVNYYLELLNDVKNKDMMKEIYEQTSSVITLWALKNLNIDLYNKHVSNNPIPSTIVSLIDKAFKEVKDKDMFNDGINVNNTLELKFIASNAALNLYLDMSAREGYEKEFNKANLTLKFDKSDISFFAVKVGLYPNTENMTIN